MKEMQIIMFSSIAHLLSLKHHSQNVWPRWYTSRLPKSGFELNVILNFNYADPVLCVCQHSHFITVQRKCLTFECKNIIVLTWLFLIEKYLTEDGIAERISLVPCSKEL